VIAYLDTSALLKPIFTSEGGSEVVAEFWAVADGVVTSRLAYPEARAALAAALRARRISSHDHERGRLQVDRLFAELELVELTDVVARSAGQLAERFALRGGDAVHLGSALAVLAGEEGVLLTWDERLARAAVDAGLAVAPGLTAT
jgi:predicted nucleic acid-binding protein